MKRPVLVVWCLLSAALTISCARDLTAWFLNLPFNMPYSLDMAIRSGLKVFSDNEMPDPEDMSDVALLIYFVIATVIAGTVVAIVATQLWRRVLSPRLK